MSTAVFSKRRAILFGWETAKNNSRFLIGLTLFAFAIYFLPSLVSSLLANIQLPALIVIFFFVAGVVFWIFQLIVTMGFAKMSLDFARGRHPKFEQIISRAPLVVKFFLATLLYQIITTIGFILLFVPGVIWGVKYQFYIYFIIDKKLGPIESLKASSRITDGVKWDLFLLNILLVLVNFLGFIVLGVGMLLTIPATAIALSYVYNKLKMHAANN